MKKQITNLKNLKLDCEKNLDQRLPKLENQWYYKVEPVNYMNQEPQVYKEYRKVYTLICLIVL